MRAIILLLFIFVLASQNISGLSIVSDYLVNDTLELISGTSAIYSIRLQNPSEEEIGIKIDYDDTLMKIIDPKDIYYLQPMHTGYKILFNITAPNEPGLYTVGYTVSELEPTTGGLPIRLKINKNFNLLVKELPKTDAPKNTKSSFIPFILALGLFIAMILFFLAKKRKKKGKIIK